ncbi:MAG TPA: hypothetical protein VM243_03960 [Phycisphaerae bacterium]|nr:hypothetical protein [Phycisphaerae bacterium]
MSQQEPNHASGEQEIGGGDPNTPATVLVGVVGAILTFVVIVALQALFYNVESQTVSRVNQGDPRRLSRRRAEQLEAINSYGWVDRQEGTVTVPIDRAMELVLDELAESGSSGAERPGE